MQVFMYVSPDICYTLAYNDRLELNTNYINIVILICIVDDGNSMQQIFRDTKGVIPII